LIVRFKIVAFVLLHIHDIAQADIIFIGRVFYRRVPPQSRPASSEDGTGNGLAVVSFYFHKC
jgi:hypothetical protein